MKTFKFDDHVFEYDDDIVFTVEDALKLIEAETTLQETRIKRDQAKYQTITSASDVICKTVSRAVVEITDVIKKANNFNEVSPDLDPVKGVEHIDFYENQDQETKKQ